MTSTATRTTLTRHRSRAGRVRPCICRRENVELFGHAAGCPRHAQEVR